jgi:hypothetical protein
MKEFRLQDLCFLGEAIGKILCYRQVGSVEYRDVLVSWECHNKIPYTGWHNQQKFYFLLVLEARIHDESASF